MQMKRLTLPFFLVAALCSCQTAHDAAVSTFRVIDAPHQYIRRQLGVDEADNTVTTTTTTTVQGEGAPDGAVYPQPYVQQAPPSYPPPQQQYAPPPPPSEPPRNVTVTERSRAPQEPTAPPRTAVTSRESQRTEVKASPTPGPPAVSQKSNLPYAKPVPGKPGYVFSPYDKNGGYVDVKGFAPGSKVKDPYSGKIFLVP